MSQVLRCCESNRTRPTTPCYLVTAVPAGPVRGSLSAPVRAGVGGGLGGAAAQRVGEARMYLAPERGARARGARPVVAHRWRARAGKGQPPPAASAANGEGATAETAGHGRGTARTTGAGERGGGCVRRSGRGRAGVSRAAAPDQRTTSVRSRIFAHILHQRQLIV
jgi:hypothetical protein